MLATFPYSWDLVAASYKLMSLLLTSWATPGDNQEEDARVVVSAFNSPSPYQVLRVANCLPGMVKSGVMTVGPAMPSSTVLKPLSYLPATRDPLAAL